MATTQKTADQFDVGSRVRTVANQGASDWNEKAKVSRRWGVTGTITRLSFTFFVVRHDDDGVEAPYEADELSLVSASEGGETLNASSPGGSKARSTMTEEDARLLPDGNVPREGTVRVRTVKPDKEATDWMPSARASLRWNEEGTAVKMSNAHGICVRVRYDDGKECWFEPHELEVIRDFHRAPRSDDVTDPGESSEDEKAPDSTEGAVPIPIHIDPSAPLSEQIGGAILQILRYPAVRAVEEGGWVGAINRGIDEGLAKAMSLAMAKHLENGGFLSDPLNAVFCDIAEYFPEWTKAPELQNSLGEWEKMACDLLRLGLVVEAEDTDNRSYVLSPSGLAYLKSLKARDAAQATPQKP